MALNIRIRFHFSPRQNGEKAVAENKNWRNELQTFLLHYRATNHTTTNVSPAESLLNRPIKTKLPDLRN